ncbi:MAG: hypothetical protein K0S38_76 [Candidatus Paceibacter sp.]|nr:hypothetical protein [Candidatus Paceibacter sp.]
MHTSSRVRNVSFPSDKMLDWLVQHGSGFHFVFASSDHDFLYLRMKMGKIEFINGIKNVDKGWFEELDGLCKQGAIRFRNEAELNALLEEAIAIQIGLKKLQIRSVMIIALPTGLYWRSVDGMPQIDSRASHTEELKRIECVYHALL